MTELQSAVTWLKRHATKQTRDGMARYGLSSENALGVAVGDIRLLGKQLGANHELALLLWKTGIYEARMLTAFVADPLLTTPAQMDAWCKDFDNWGICDTLCFHLFDKTPHAWTKVEQWSEKRPDFVKRASFALLASIAGVGKAALRDLTRETVSQRLARHAARNVDPTTSGKARK